VVVQDPDINACALPGGKVVINSGLVDRFEGDDDALAFVIAHEIGHVTARHSAEQLTLSAATQVMAVVAQTIVAVAGAASAVAAVPAALAMGLAAGIGTAAIFIEPATSAAAFDDR
jgi:predicted Zn-dependent protease